MLERLVARRASLSAALSQDCARPSGGLRQRDVGAEQRSKSRLSPLETVARRRGLCGIILLLFGSADRRATEQNMFDLTGRVALVTGAGRGIGAGIARQLAVQGAAVAVNDLVLDRANSTASTIVEGGNRAFGIAFDVTDYESVVSGVKEIEAELGPVDILVNNAGVPEQMGMAKFRDTEPADWVRPIDINIYGVLNCSRVVIDGMCDRGFGRVITISSGAGTAGVGLGVSAYGAGKGGGLGFMRNLALEVARKGVTANSLALGLMNNVVEEILPVIEKSIPVGRTGQPEEVGACCVYLASNEAGWMTGQTIQLNGGSVTT
jgi:3-oxoacyl-[acyl-carrier protein] reductase